MTREEFEKWYKENNLNLMCEEKSILEEAWQHQQKKIDELFTLLLESKQTICQLCVRLNPQHENCTYCDDMRDILKALDKKEGKQ